MDAASNIRLPQRLDFGAREINQAKVHVTKAKDPSLINPQDPQERTDFHDLSSDIHTCAEASIWCLPVDFWLISPHLISCMLSPCYALQVRWQGIERIAGQHLWRVEATVLRMSVKVLLTQVTVLGETLRLEGAAKPHLGNWLPEMEKNSCF